MSFDDSFYSREDRYSLGVQSTLGKYYASFPVSSGFVDYIEYYELTSDQYHAFVMNKAAAVEFVNSCRRHEHDELLIQKPGSNRGTPV
jgi:hypothetical protein